MRKPTLLILLLLLAFSALAQTTWTVQTVPNTRLEGNEIHVSDPDNYLSDSAEMSINTALCAIRDRADVFVVTLASIGEAEPKRFATQLFNHWGIGDTETDNGVLLLFVEDQHALEFETGYGAEETLTDAKCERIFTKAIVPFFRAGDYEGGLCAGVAEIVTAFGGEIPVGLKSNLPDSDGGSSGSESDWSNFFLFFGLMVMVLPFVGIVYWLKKRKDKSPAKMERYRAVEEAGVGYLNDDFKTAWSGSPWEGRGCLGGLTLGFSILLIFFVVYVFFHVKYPDAPERWTKNWVAAVSLLVYFTWICFRQSHRALKVADRLAKTTVKPKEIYNAAIQHKATRWAMALAPWLGVVYYNIFKKRIAQCEEYQCPKCSAAMKKDKDFVLPEIHALESRLKALKFEPYRCPNGHTYVLQGQGTLYGKFRKCEKCGAYTAKLTEVKTVVKANYNRTGEKSQTFVCQNCGEISFKTIDVPKLVHYSSYSSDSSSSFSSSSGRSYSSSNSSSSSRSSHSSGSFGGGRSGGGGYSGKW